MKDAGSLALLAAPLSPREMESVAAARLRRIRAAAPEMFAALVACERTMAPVLRIVELSPEDSQALADAREAIAKARGEDRETHTSTLTLKTSRRL